LEQDGHPFEFSTEASLNVADDDELLCLLQEAGFFALFIGIETPDRESLIQTRKKQNTRRDIAESVHRIYQHGMFVNAGFIIGFDAEKGDVAEAMIDCIESAAIPVCMVGLLYALPNTDLSPAAIRGRLHAESDRPSSDDDADQCTSGLNYTTLRSRRETLEDYRRVLSSIYSPASFFSRVERMVDSMDLSKHSFRPTLRHVLRDLRSFVRIHWKSGLLDRDVRGAYWHALTRAFLRNPRALKVVVSLAALYLHLKPFSQFVDSRLAGRIDSLDRGDAPPALAVRILPDRGEAQMAFDGSTSDLSAQGGRR
jgi:hypothetical protein